MKGCGPDGRMRVEISKVQEGGMNRDERETPEREEV